MLKIFASGGITFCQELQKKDKYISEALADPRMESWGALVRKEGKRNNQTGLRLNDLLACLNINNLPPRQPPHQVPGLRLMAQTSETFSDKDKTLADTWQYFWTQPTKPEGAPRVSIGKTRSFLCA